MDNHNQQSLALGATIEAPTFSRQQILALAIRNFSMNFENTSAPTARNSGSQVSIMNSAAPGECGNSLPTSGTGGAGCPHAPQIGPQPSQSALPFSHGYTVGAPSTHSTFGNLNQHCVYNCCYLPTCAAKQASGMCNQYGTVSFQQPQQRGYPSHAPPGPSPTQSTTLRYYYPYPGQACVHVSPSTTGNHPSPRESGYWVPVRFTPTPTMASTQGQCLTPRMPGQGTIQLASPPQSSPRLDGFTQPAPPLHPMDPPPARHICVPFEKNGTIARTPVASPRSRRRHTQRRSPMASPPQTQSGSTDPPHVPSSTARSSGPQFAGGFQLFSRGYVGYQITYSPQSTQDRRAVTPPGRITIPLVSLVPLKPDGTSTRVTLTFEVHRV